MSVCVSVTFAFKCYASLVDQFFASFLILLLLLLLLPFVVRLFSLRSIWTTFLRDLYAKNYERESTEMQCKYKREKILRKTKTEQKRWNDGKRIFFLKRFVCLGNVSINTFWNVCWGCILYCIYIQCALWLLDFKSAITFEWISMDHFVFVFIVFYSFLFLLRLCVCVWHCWCKSIGIFWHTSNAAIR